MQKNSKNSENKDEREIIKELLRNKKFKEYTPNEENQNKKILNKLLNDMLEDIKEKQQKWHFKRKREKLKTEETRIKEAIERIKSK